ncbi:DUF2927 domain-containing protein [Poseidonocella sp. HB161398]|uniref:DUF2927 domain-containing protein n=1 Tax=Poseidonocella sp. HB161398 TaxID=2320855 RepID=UPI001109F865|nr:DUF2927 domain-containing protein [Poseidonocella sp. HB161398]
MRSFRNTPLAGALAMASFALFLSMAPSASRAGDQTVLSTQGTAIAVTPKTGSARSEKLASYYHGMEKRLVSSGHLRRDRNPGKLSPDGLARDFMAIAMKSEYSLKAGGMARSGQSSALRRWEQPVRIGVKFGASVGAEQRKADMAALRDIAARLQRASGHPVQLASSGANFHILILNDDERAAARPVLEEVAPRMSRAARKAVLGMTADTLCMAVAMPGPSPADGYRNALAIVRAEHSPVMRRSCMEEELAQGMGLANDSPEAWPSIFNDDEEFGVLTRHDELLLKMLYHDSLHPGMSAGAVSGQIGALARKVLASG